MVFVRGMFAAIVLAALCVVSPPGTASADQVMQGVYNYVEEGINPTTWTITPVCVPTVGDLREPLYLAVACKLLIAASTPSTGDGAGKDTYAGNAILTNNVWTFSFQRPDGVQCPNGGTAAGMEMYEFDDRTLTGTRTFSRGAVCGLQPDLVKTPFTLVFNRPLPAPVDPYALDCEPAGLRICR